MQHDRASRQDQSDPQSQVSPGPVMPSPQKAVLELFIHPILHSETYDEQCTELGGRFIVLFNVKRQRRSLISGTGDLKCFPSIGILMKATIEKVEGDLILNLSIHTNRHHTT